MPLPSSCNLPFANRRHSRWKCHIHAQPLHCFLFLLSSSHFPHKFAFLQISFVLGVPPPPPSSSRFPGCHVPSQGLSPSFSTLCPPPSPSSPPWAQLLHSSAFSSFPPDSPLPIYQLRPCYLLGVLHFSLATHWSRSIQGDSQGGHWVLRPALLRIYN